ncbi:MAG TPA: hypothetical protein VJ738_07665 [Steroidobacteraceae bacterium]|nr:hypothetical protein [Steroidobacteraceae bacterium]
MIDGDESSKGVAVEDKPPKAKRTRGRRKKSGKRSGGGTKRVRVARSYPALTFEESLPLAEAIQTHASGERVSRLTLLKAMNLSPTSSATQILITSSAKYGLTKGSYVAEHLELTPEGRTATDRATQPRDRTQVRFDLAIKRIAPFQVLYDRYQGKKLPSPDVLKDVLNEAQLQISDLKECIDTFVVNAKDIGLLQTIAGSETLVPISVLIEQLPPRLVTASGDLVSAPASIASPAPVSPATGDKRAGAAAGAVPNWHKICFYVTPIGDEGSELRKHSDLFLSSLIEPALEGFGLEVIRADKIGQPGMITSQILEHLLRARLVIADLSHHNPNVFYELAIRHFAKLPVVQIIRKADKLPFDVNQVRTTPIDTTDIYTLVPKLETFRAEIATAVRGALEGQAGSNPISLFFPGITVSIPR